MTITENNIYTILTRHYKTFLLLLFIIFAIGFSGYTTENDEQENDGKIYSSDGVLLSCGVERWAVKTCIDADTTHVNFNIIVPSTIAYQRSLPVQPTLPPNNRLPLEDTVYQLDARLARIKLEDDGDVHCVIVSGVDTMVSEICDPTCPGISTTSRYPALLTLRNWIINTYHPTSSWQYPNIMVRITGVGFYDFLHGQIGIPPNGREIHPILSMVVITGTENISGSMPVEFSLKQNYPNPFNPVTKIVFDLPRAGNVQLEIFDAAGKTISRIIDNEYKSEGSYSITFDASNQPSGIYFYRLISGSFNESRKMVLVK